jgi:hypothetical protein
MTPFKSWLPLVLIVNQTKHGAQIVWWARFAVRLEFLTSQIIIGPRRAQNRLNASHWAVLPRGASRTRQLSLLLLEGAPRARHLLIILHS